MRKLCLPALLLISSATMFSCSKSGGDNNSPAPKDVNVTLAKPQMKADAFDEMWFVVKDKDGLDVTATATIKVDNVIDADKKFTTGTVGAHKVHAIVNGKSSDTITFNAISPGTSPFSRKILVEDYTGTWCQYCPRVAYKLKNFKTSNPKLIWIANHGPSGQDPMAFQYHQQMKQASQLSGYPSAHVNRKSEWDEQNASLNQELSFRAPLGIAIETSVNGSTVTVITKVKYDVTTSAPMKLLVMLTEDGLVYPQQNSISTYGTTPVITNFVHDMTLRKAGTDVFGDPIPVVEQKEGSVYTHTSTINATGYNMSKLKVVASVMLAGANPVYSGCLNTQEVVVGQNKNFD